jgi:hypothetical protein
MLTIRVNGRQAEISLAFRAGRPYFYFWLNKFSKKPFDDIRVLSAGNPDLPWFLRLPFSVLGFQESDA